MTKVGQVSVITTRSTMPMRHLLNLLQWLRMNMGMKPGFATVLMTFLNHLLAVLLDRHLHHHNSECHLLEEDILDPCHLLVRLLSLACRLSFRQWCRFPVVRAR